MDLSPSALSVLFLTLEKYGTEPRVKGLQCRVRFDLRMFGQFQPNPLILLAIAQALCDVA
jgi:hypothetical protein